MKTSSQNLKSQRGAASLFTSIILLVSITLVTLFTAKTVLMETKITADDYRTSQATAAAQAAMDQATAYYAIDNKMDRNVTDTLDYTLASPMEITLTSGLQTTRAQYYFDNTTGNICNSLVTNFDKGLITATGWSDDGLAVRTITQCVSKSNLLASNGPQQPFITQGSVGIAGNATLINRFNNSNLWAGGNLGSAGAAFATYLRPAGTTASDLTWAEKSGGCPNPCSPGTASNNVRLISNTKAGFGVDVIANDPTLGNKSATEMFAMFFGNNTKNDIKAFAADEGQLYTTTAEAAGKSSVIWVDGSGSAPDIGLVDDPALLVVDGDFTIGSNATIYGVIYVIGTLTINGSPDIYGTIISESGTTAGTGSPTIVFVPWFSGDSPIDSPAYPAPIPGSWKDW